MDEIYDLGKKLESVLTAGGGVEMLTSWLDSLVNSFVVKPCVKMPIGSLRKVGRQFILAWSTFGTKVGLFTTYFLRAGPCVCVIVCFRLWNFT